MTALEFGAGTGVTSFMVKVLQIIKVSILQIYQAFS
jgi:hypothetical protein